MRLSSEWRAEKSIAADKLYYMSVHSLDSAETYQYARNRVFRETLDKWVDKKFEYGGLRFRDDEPTLSDADAGFGCCFAF